MSEYGTHEAEIPHVMGKNSSRENIVTRSRAFLATFAGVFFVGSVGTLNNYYHGLQAEVSAMEEVDSLGKMTDSPVIKGTSLKLYSRSIASSDAQADVSFVAELTGMTVVENITYSCDETSPGYTSSGTSCATKISAGTIQGFSLTYFQSHVTPQGDITVKDWAKNWVEEHDFNQEGWEWNEWVPQSVTFYTPLLTAHVKKLKDSGTAHLLRRYLMDGETIFSVRFAVPNSGHVIEIISDKVAGTIQNQFDAYLFNECPPASVVGHSLFDLKEQWETHGGSISNANGLPDLLVVQISQPVSTFDTNLTKLSTDLSRFTGAHLNVTTHDYMDHHYNCSFEDIYIEVVKMNDATNFAVPIRLVHNLRAKLSKYTVEHYISSTMKTMDEQMGTNKGFSRYADWHLGLYMEEGGTTLDGNADVMEHDGVGYFNSGDKSTEMGGSNYARGGAGIAIQYVGEYDYTRFARKSITTLDYCSSIGKASDHTHRLNESYCPSDYDKYNDDA